MINVQFHHTACIKAQSEYFSSYLVTRPQDLTQAVPKHGEEVSFELGKILYAENSVAIILPTRADDIRMNTTLRKI